MAKLAAALPSERPTRTADDVARRRIGWLLRINRTLRHDGLWAVGSEFARSFRGGCWQVDVSAVKVCRWETGVTSPPREAIARYEEMLDLPARALSSVADLIWRDAGHVLPRGASVSESPDDDQFSALVDRAISGDVISAADWNTLTAYLNCNPGLMLLKRAYEALTERLLIETVASRDCLLWMARYEAYSRLLAHEYARGAAIDKCVRLTSDEGTFIAVEPMSLLGGVKDPNASSYIVRQLANPTTEQTFYGALLASATRGQIDLFTPDQATVVRRIAREATTPDPAGHYAEVSVVGRHLWSLLDSSPASRRVAREFVPRLTGDGEAQRVDLVDRILRKTWEHIDDIQDDMLPELIDSLIFSPTINARLQSGLLLLQSPYREAVAAAIGAQLSNIRTANERVATTRSLLAALRTLGTDAERRTVETYVLSGAHPAIVEAAVFAVGHVGGSSSPEFWRRAVDMATHQYQALPSATNSRTLAEVMYALGVDRQMAILRNLTGHSQHKVRTAAQWWLSLPPAIYEGVLQ
jgi:hypothetical protein